MLCGTTTFASEKRGSRGPEFKRTVTIVNPLGRKGFRHGLMVEIPCGTGTLSDDRVNCCETEGFMVVEVSVPFVYTRFAYPWAETSRSARRTCQPLC
jgi:hypothetical protein